MPRALEQKLKREYPNNPHAVYGTLNKIGAMKGNKETAKGKAIQKKMSIDVTEHGNAAARSIPKSLRRK